MDISLLTLGILKGKKVLFKLTENNYITKRMLNFLCCNTWKNSFIYPKMADLWRHYQTYFINQKLLFVYHKVHSK